MSEIMGFAFNNLRKARMMCAVPEDNAIDQYIRTYRAVVSAANSVLGVLPPKRKPISVWVLLLKMPNFEEWAEFFGTESRWVHNVEDGILREVSSERLQAFQSVAQEFFLAVENYLSDRAARVRSAS